jgi:nitroimidazol reductase NimA-like FMN-containing flavoprotein (pyridoxamine 5'-phosphate oxidase superfamily)
MIFGELSAAQVNELLASESVARLGCISNGNPYVIPIQYACEPDGDSVVIHSLEGEKVRAMRKLPNVCLEVDRVETPVSWQSVVAQGVFEELRGDEARTALDRLVQRLLPPGQVPAGVDPFCPPGAESQVVMFRVRLREKSGRFASP